MPRKYYNTTSNGGTTLGANSEEVFGVLIRTLPGVYVLRIPERSKDSFSRGAPASLAATSQNPLTELLVDVQMNARLREYKGRKHMTDRVLNHYKDCGWMSCSNYGNFSFSSLLICSSSNGASLG
ncbi:uncharacterized protein PHACADRAFT_187226 [Phanerochaete carnosa HHB-10118-sp]|uniref:Uncharacterized protein n=1 Tax=Phanerochaete carnosa (strain HHB-10118-sp) TaxID=650164 RepID=K5UPW3_PHACS|nr:uncharacterized protein PHACADRAFT_187226 [Phanerochaete carnosa HHB-10118-sp]EKM51831.1 hypothetical protein PHACADRAFT_187226 [Phanerochaete carnosa HHB-10118-sp]